MKRLLTKFILVLAAAFLLLIVPSNYAHAASSGNVVAWGSNGFGQLGNGTSSGDNNFPPIEVQNLNNVIAVANGDHSLALKADGTLWGWGWNEYGQIGDGTNQERHIPVQVKDPSDASGFLKQVIAISASHYNSLALKSDGTVWVWGMNPSFEQPDGILVHPVQVKKIDDQPLSNIKSISAGLFSNYLAVKSDGTLWEWKTDYLEEDKKAAQVKGEDGVGFLTGVSNTAVGWNHFLAARGNGTVWSWGNNQFGQLGDGSENYESTYPVKAINLTNVKSVAAGDSFSLALKNDGSVWSWGLNVSGQLGIGSVSDYNKEHNSPIQVKNPEDPSGYLSNIVSITAGGSWAFAIDKNGTVWSWGENSDGFLAQGTTENSLFPQKAAVLNGAINISLNDAHGLAIIADTGTKLNVPLLKQGIFPFTDSNPLWERNEFDHANAGQFTCGKTMAQCGCSTTSIAMILKYYNINKLPNGENLDPGSLNKWLKDNNGYDRNAGVRWSVAATIAKKAKAQNPQFSYGSLEYDPNRTYNPTKLKNDLKNSLPNILQVNAPGIHFVVATGEKDNAFTINDPLFNKISLSQYNNNADSVRRYVPANSDMSYITYEVDKDVDIEVKDENGNLVGESYLEYSPAQLTEEPNIIDSSVIKVHYFAKPSSGIYTVKVSSSNAKYFQLDEVVITQEGDVKEQTFKGFLVPTSSSEFNIQYDKQSTGNSNTVLVVTPEKLKAKLKALYTLHMIDNLGIYNSLNSKLDDSSFNAFIKELNAQRGKHITEEAFQLLKQDALILLGN